MDICGGNPVKHLNSDTISDIRELLSKIEAKNKEQQAYINAIKVKLNNLEEDEEDSDSNSERRFSYRQYDRV